MSTDQLYLGVGLTIARVVAVAAGCDMVRDGTGLIAGILPPGHDLLFRVRVSGTLLPVVGGGTPAPLEGDVDVLFGPNG